MRQESEAKHKCFIIGVIVEFSDFSLRFVCHMNISDTISSPQLGKSFSKNMGVTEKLEENAKETKTKRGDKKTDSFNCLT